MGIKHAFTSTKDDGGDSTLVKPSNWNADHDLSGADVTDIPTADTDTTKVLAPDGAGGVEWRADAMHTEILDIPTAETDTALVLAPDGAGGVEFRAAAGGSVGDGKDYIHTPPASAHATDDEFNDGTGMSGPVNGLDVKWSKHNLGTAGWTILSDSVAPGCVLFDIPTGQTGGQYIYQTIPSGDWTYAARWHPHYMEARAMFGLIAVSSAGTGVSCCIDQNGSWGIRTITTWADGGGGTFGPANNYSADYQSASGVRAPLNITLRKASGVYYAGWSFSDRLKPGNYHEISHTPAAFTPAYIGFGRIYGGVGTTYLLDFFRKVA